MNSPLADLASRISWRSLREWVRSTRTARWIHSDRRLVIFRITRPTNLAQVDSPGGVSRDEWSHLERFEVTEHWLTREEFLEYTRSVWTLPAVQAKSIGHPAPFPVELPRRLVQLYTFSGDVVMDPFMGSGQTAIAALETGRQFVGYEINPEYVALAQQRIAHAGREKSK